MAFLQFFRVGIYLTQVAPICSMAGWRNIRPESERVRGWLCNRTGLQGIPVPAEIAGGGFAARVAGRFTSGQVRSVLMQCRQCGHPDLGNGCSTIFGGRAQAFGGLVPGHVLAGEPEERSQRHWACRRVLGLGSYKNSMDVAAQACGGAMSTTGA